MRVLQFPLIKITGCFVFGLLLAHYIKPPFFVALIALIISFIAVIITYIIPRKTIIPKNHFGIATFLAAFLIGVFTFVSNNQTRNKLHYIHFISTQKKNYTATITLKEKLKNTTVNYRYVAQMITLNGKESYGKVLLNLKKNPFIPTLEIGTILKVKGSFYKNRNPNNPNQFDYGNYLENQQIYGQLYVKPSDIQVGSFTDKGIAYHASLLRNRIIRNLEKNHFHKTELNVVVALLLGQQQDISPEVVKDYQYAGAVHVLSVSGLHVGFILLFITFLLRPFPNTRTGSIVKLIIVITFLWAFGILAGLAPSVVRSVTMFSFVAIGMYLRRSINIYNTLAVSALLILLFQPSFLFDVGFQLSYVALYFIVWLQPFLASAWNPKYIILRQFWEIITVSFAAQIGTLPMSIYYFHQFPGLFFVTNIVILPGMSLILGLGVIVMFLAALDWVWMPLLKSLECCIWALNKIIAWVASFENFVFKDIPLHYFSMWGLYLVIFSSFIWMKKPSYRKFIATLFALIILQIIAITIKYTNEKAEEFIIFNKQRTSIFTKRIGDKVTVFTSENLEKNANANLVLKSYLVANYCSIQKKKNIPNLLYFKNKKILVIDSSGAYLEKERPDILLLINSPKINLERVFQNWKPQKVVVDASNYKSYCKIWKATCVKEKIPFHDTAEKGFFKL
ncbi:ComEC/Rec2 family competence protein [Flavobacterium sp.]|jgi:competence protein ComEC|uniref:ComEC/Rec2 family competence protein n=1 Tax=Flavobacterium sp. TaxID=239 RepID=UPI0037C03B0C